MTNPTTRATGLLYWSDRSTRDSAFNTFFRGRLGCSCFDALPHDDTEEDGPCEMTNIREGYYIEVPVRLRRAWLAAQEERNAKGLRGPAHATARTELYRSMLDAAG